jgi:signal recognition particle receptor subunit beta
MIVADMAVFYYRIVFVNKVDMKKSDSPMKVKDYFANPVHKIKQPAFVEVGFNQSTLNTFVNNFTNRYSNRYISYSAIKQFIKSFSKAFPI